MTQSTLKWIIVLMSIALTGLIAFQAYWIRNAIHISRERFKQDVHDALNVVSDKLEQQEVLYTAAKKLQFYQKGQTFIGLDTIKFITHNANIDSSKRVLIKNEDLAKFLAPDTLNLDNDQIAISFDALEMPTKEVNGGLINNDVLVEIKRYKANIDSVKEYDHSLNKDIEKVKEKSQMVTVVLNELLSKERKISNRINKEQLDSLLTSALKDRGIDIKFDYGVINAERDSIILTNAPGNENNLLYSDYKASLFNRDIIAQSNYLAVFFPDQQSFLIGKIWVSMASSIILVLIIIICFAYAIYTILHQKKVSEIKNDFINNMTHEFKTPISTVSLACEALQDDQVNKNEAFLKRYLSIIQDENNRLGLQVEKVLQMATLDKKDLKLKLEKIDVHDVIDRALQNINFQIEKRGGRIVKNLNASNKNVVSDEVHLTNIVYNLLDNANKYSKENPDITIETENSKGGIIVRIADRGIGMSKEVVSRIFEKFYRVPTGNLHDVKGFGLGLAYVKTMLDALGGQIGVRSTVNKGSTFEIYLPQNG